MASVDPITSASGTVFDSLMVIPTLGYAVIETFWGHALHAFLGFVGAVVIPIAVSYLRTRLATHSQAKALEAAKLHAEQLAEAVLTAVERRYGSDLAAEIAREVKPIEPPKEGAKP